MTNEYTKEDYEAKIAELEKQLEEAQSNNGEGFDELKNKYEKVIEEKDQKIQELNETVEQTRNEVDSTVNNLNDEVQARLEATEAYKDLLTTVEQLEKDKAEALVDKYIHEGKIVPAQKEAALKLAINNNDAFLDLYRDAKPIVDTNRERKSIPVGTAERIVNYLKN